MPEGEQKSNYAWVVAVSSIFVVMGAVGFARPAEAGAQPRREPHGQKHGGWPDAAEHRTEPLEPGNRLG